MKVLALIWILCVGQLSAQSSIAYLTNDTLSAQPNLSDWAKKGNGRFNFWFDYPSTWTVEAKSANGDGFFINCHDSSIDARVYGTNRVLDDDGDVKLISEDHSSDQFTFVDGSVGKRFFSDVDQYYVRIEPETLIIFYVHAPMNALKEKKDVFDRVGKSLRLGRQTIKQK